MMPNSAATFTSNSKHILIVNQSAPYSSSHAREALDLAFAAATFEQIVSVLFMGDGCYQLLPNQGPKSIDSKCVAQMLKALPIYGVTELLTDQRSLTERQITEFADGLNVRVLSETDLKNLYQSATTVLRF